MNIEEALKWADVFGKIQSDPPTGDAPALTMLAAEVRRLRAAISETLADNLHLADGENCTLIKLKRAAAQPNGRELSHPVTQAHANQKPEANNCGGQ